MGARAGPFSQRWLHRDRLNLGKPGLTASASAWLGLALLAQPCPRWLRNAGPKRCLLLATEWLRAAWQSPAGRKPGSTHRPRLQHRQKLNFGGRSRPEIVLHQAAVTYTCPSVTVGLNAACAHSPRCRQGSRSPALVGALHNCGSLVSKSKVSQESKWQRSEPSAALQRMEKGWKTRVLAGSERTNKTLFLESCQKRKWPPRQLPVFPPPHWQQASLTKTPQPSQRAGLQLQPQHCLPWDGQGWGSPRKETTDILCPV